MKFAIIGGTHGNEPTGVEVIKFLENEKPTFLNSYETFFANPEAYKICKRYVDSDLNRAFGEKGVSQGYEAKRSKEIEEQICGNFDFIVDLHTTTSNMGSTIILTDFSERTIKAACYLKEKNPELVIIFSSRAGEVCPYTTSLASSGLIVEIGPVANGILKAQKVFDTHKVVTDLLDFDFKKDFNYQEIECYHTKGMTNYPEGHWMVHPDIDGNDFRKVEEGDPIFINLKKEVLTHKGEAIYPLFINEAAYQESNTAFEFAIKTNVGKLKDSIQDDFSPKNIALPSPSLMKPIFSLMANIGIFVESFIV